MIGVSLAYASADGQQWYQEMQVAESSTILAVIEQSGWLSLPCLREFGLWLDAHINQDPNHKAWYVGIYSIKKRLDTPLKDGDRIEIYRPLSDDPMAKRKGKSKIKLKKLGYRPDL